MSLVAWYPLNGDLKDRGPFGRDLEMYPVTQDPSWINGKTGKAFQINDGIEKTENVNISQLSGKRIMSISFWNRVDSINSSYGDIVSFETSIIGTNGNNFTLRLESLSSSAVDGVGLTRINWYANSTFTDDGGVGWTRINFGDWQHVVLTMDGSKFNFYINGNLVSSKAFISGSENITLTGNFAIGSRNNDNNPKSHSGAISNIKIYDHVLSKKEILEDYKQPILHYSFENPYCEPTVNLTNEILATDVTLGSDDFGNYFIKDSSMTTGWKGIRHKNVKVQAGKTYSWSLDVYSDVDFEYVFDGNTTKDGNTSDNDSIHTILRGYPHYNSANARGKVEAHRWQRVYFTLKVNDDVTSDSINMASCFCPYIPSGETELKVYYKNSQFEEKPYNTPYCEDERESSVIIDNSGMQNIMNLSSDCPNWNPDDSATGSYSLNFKDNKYLYSNSFLNNAELKQMTFCMWVKYLGNDSSSAMNGQAYPFCKLGTFLFGLWKTGYRFRFWHDKEHQTSNDSYMLSVDKDIDQEWHFYCFVFDNGIRKCYFDGELEKSYNGNSEYIDNNNDNQITYIGKRADATSYLNGNVDDFRIYSIALNDNEIQELYKSKMKIDKDGNSYCSKLIEYNPKNLIDEPEDFDWIGNNIKFSNDGIENGITTITFTQDVSEVNSVGVYIKTQDLFTPLMNKLYRYSLWVKSSVGGNWKIGHERMFPNSTTNYILEAGKWNKIQFDGSPVKNLGQNNFVFYVYANSGLNNGDFIQIKDFKFYEINDSIKNSKISKKGQFKTFELNEIDNSLAEETGAEIIQKYNATWLKVFYHNSKSGTIVFANDNEVLHCETVDKFSVLEELENFRGRDGKFEFLLEYPEDYPDEYNRWKQTDNPTIIQEDSSLNGTKKANGYEPIHIDWIYNYWGGLLLRSANDAFIDGSVNHSNWFYAIGVKKNSWKNSNGSVAGYVPGPNKRINGTINLYVRLDNIDNNFNEFKLFKRQTQTKEIKEI